MLDYDYRAESARLSFPDVQIGNKRINRGKCLAGVTADFSWKVSNETKEDVYSTLLPSTLRGSAPVVNLANPIAGHYIYDEKGILFDSYLGVGQRLIDEQHPRLASLLDKLLQYKAFFRREAATNEFIVCDSDEAGLATPQEYSRLVCGLAQKAFRVKGPYLCFFSSSGSESVEAGIKIACRHCHHQIIQRYGYGTERKIMSVFDIDREHDFGHPADTKPVYKDYPFYFLVPRGAFHGRTLGALSLTDVRPVQKRGFPSGVRVIRIPFNEESDSIDRLVDNRNLTEILGSPGGLGNTLASGRVPRELIAGVVLEAYQGEGGYVKADSDWITGIALSCNKLEIPVMVDEVQTFARTGKVFASEHYGIAPDIISLSKPCVVGLTLATEKFAQSQPLGWHSNTWGGGRVFDINYGYEVIDTFINYKDDHFLGHRYLENTEIKGIYIQHRLQALAEKYARNFIDLSGSGCFWGLRIRDRDRFCRIAQNKGLKLLTVGVTEEISTVRALFLADVLTKEIDCYCRLLENVLIDMDRIG